MPPRPSDAELVAAILDATRHLGPREAARATGIGAMAFSRWKAGKWKRINPATRGKIERYLMTHPPKPAPSADTLTGSQRQRAIRMIAALRADMDRRLVEILQVLRQEG